MATQFSEVIKSFHSGFADKVEIPDSLELMWLERSIAEYGVEISPLAYDKLTNEFSENLDQYVIDTLAVMMKVMYLQRHYSKVNKIASIVGNDLSVNSGMSLSKYAEDELAKTLAELEDRLTNLKPTAYN